MVGIKEDQDMTVYHFFYEISKKVGFLLSKSFCPNHCRCISANCCSKGSIYIYSICSIFTTKWFLKVVHCFLKIALKMQVVPDTDTALWRKLSKCSTSTDQPGSLLNIVAYIQNTGGTEITHCALSEWY